MWLFKIMKKFYRTSRSWWDAEKRIPRAVKRPKASNDSLRDSTEGVPAPYGSKYRSSPRWQKSERTIDSGKSRSTAEKLKIRKTVRRAVNKIKKPTKLVVDVVNDVLFFNNKKNKIFHEDCTGNSSSKVGKSEESLTSSPTDNSNVAQEEVGGSAQSTAELPQCSSKDGLEIETEVSKIDQSIDVTAVKSDSSSSEGSFEPKRVKTGSKGPVKEERVLHNTVSKAAVMKATNKVVNRIIQEYNQIVSSQNSLNKDFKKVFSMAKDSKKFEDLGKLLYDLVQKEVKPVKQAKVTPVAKKPAKPEVSRLVGLCTGQEKVKHNYVLADLVTPSHLASFKDVKNVLIHLMGLKPFEFSGVTRNLQKQYSFLVRSDAMARYLANMPHSEAARLVPWSMEDLQARVSIGTLISSNILSSNPSDKGLKKAASLLSMLLQNNDALCASEFIFKGNPSPQTRGFDL